MSEPVDAIIEKDPDQMTQTELNDLLFGVIDTLVTSNQKLVESVKNIQTSLAQVSETFSTHEECITQLQDSVIELRQMMEVMKSGTESTYSHVSKGGIILQ